jgi:hypothetical protein
MAWPVCFLLLELKMQALPVFISGDVDGVGDSSRKPYLLAAYACACRMHGDGSQITMPYKIRKYGRQAKIGVPRSFLKIRKSGKKVASP